VFIVFIVISCIDVSMVTSIQDFRNSPVHPRHRVTLFQKLPKRPGRKDEERSVFKFPVFSNSCHSIHRSLHAKMKRR